MAIIHRSILLLGTPFFGYIDRIENGLKELGFTNVDLKYSFTDKIYSRFIRYTTSKISSEIYTKIRQKYYNQLIKQLKPHYDVILILNGNTIPSQIIQELKIKYSSSEFILYLFDDQRLLKHQVDYLKYFNKIYSYSLSDSEEFGFEFRPFFFNRSIESDKKIDISFIGTLHGNRYKFLRDLERTNHDLKFHNLFYTDFLSFIKNGLFINHRLLDLSFSKLPYESYIEILASSIATVEIPRPNQMNVTTRAIEILGTRTKLITLSNSVKNYDFYNKENILVLQESNSPILTDWLKTPYRDYDEDLLHHYSLEGWLSQIFGY